jgi:ketosteroid isomerase-like protein
LIQRIVAVAGVAALAWFGWGWLFPSDEAEINAVLERIADGVSGSAAAGGVEALARVASLRDEFAVDVVVDAGPPFQSMKGREAIIAAAARANQTRRHLDVQFEDVAVTVATDRTSATATATAEAHFDEAGGRSVDARELEIVFTRPDGHWVISAVKLLEPLERLDGR